MDQPYVQQPVVVMPAGQTESRFNGLALFGFLLAVIGLFIPTGIVALLGMILCFAALGRPPRVLATLGVIIGFLGSVIWLLIMGLAVVAGLVGALGAGVMGVGMAGAFMLTQPEAVEVTADMVRVAAATERYHHEHDEMPVNIKQLGIGIKGQTDPWGGLYIMEQIDEEPYFNILCAGPDGSFGTDDDITLLTLEDYLDDVGEQFEDQMDRLGEKMDEHHSCTIRIDDDAHSFMFSHEDEEMNWQDYEARAEQELKALDADRGVDARREQIRAMIHDLRRELRELPGHEADPGSVSPPPVPDAASEPAPPAAPLPPNAA
jgi:hypothetical protein